MSEERDTPHEVSPLPDSISNLDSVESVNRCSPVVTAVPNSTQVPAAAENSLNVESQIDSPLLPDSSPGCHITDNVLKNNSNGGERTHPPIAPRELLLSASSTSAFRPFFTQASAQPTGLVCGSSTYTEAHPITSTPVSRRSERLATLPGASTFTSLQSFPQLSLPQDTSHAGESTIIINSNVNDENDDGRTTASAPPCTPAPEPYQQPQSPFRNNRQIKKIDLLAMSRSRQSDRAENARRDGRLAPSPRKKDEVLRNSGFIFPAGRGFAHPPNMRLSMQQNSNPPLASNISPDRTANRSSNTASPNVDVVSVDDQQPDPSKCMFSIQFHDFSRAEQMMKCSLCGFVTNNSRFYRRHRRMHSRQYQPNLIHCNSCDYSTSQIRRMREHTMSHHPHPQPSSNIRASGSSSQNQVSMLDAASHHLHQPQFQGHLMINGRETSTGANFILPVTGHQPINLGPSSAIAPPPRAPAAQPISATSTLGLPTYMPTPLDGVGPTATHHLPAAGLQHPPQGSALLRNYSAEEQQQQMADYMQSLLSNLITPAHTNPGNSATSTGLFMQVAGNRHAPSATQQNATLSTNRGQLPEDGYNFRRLWSNNVTATSGNNGNASMGHMTGPSGFFKVKTEPIHQNHNRHHDSRIAQDLPSSTQKEHLSRRESCRQSDILDSESGMDMSSDDPASSPQPPPLHRSRLDTHINRDNILSTVTTSSCGGDACSLVQSSAVGGVSSQCAMPFIKIEFPPHRESCNLTHGGFSNNSSRNERSTTVLVDRETQCEIISASNLRGGVVSGSSRQIGGRTQSETVSSAGGGSSTGASGTPGSVIDTRCYFCGVTFDDDVLFSIHVGCHSHTDPFMCNVCGKQCHNKYGFYSHIMRGHQA